MHTSRFISCARFCRRIFIVLKDAHFILINQKNGLFCILCEAAHYLGASEGVGPLIRSTSIITHCRRFSLCSRLFLGGYGCGWWHCGEAILPFLTRAIKSCTRRVDAPAIRVRRLPIPHWLRQCIRNTIFLSKLAQKLPHILIVWIPTNFIRLLYRHIRL